MSTTNETPPDMFGLLKEYIAWVSAMEGSDFIPKDRERNISDFTDQQLTYLYIAAGWDEQDGEYK